MSAFQLGISYYPWHDNVNPVTASFLASEFKNNVDISLTCDF